MRSIYIATCLSLGIFASVTTGVHADQTSSMSQPAAVGDEYVRLLTEIAEYEFDVFCAFNGFRDRPSLGVLNTYPCIEGGDYRAVLINGAVRIFKRDGDRMIKLEKLVNRDRSSSILADVRRVFGLPETAN